MSEPAAQLAPAEPERAPVEAAPQAPPRAGLSDAATLALLALAVLVARALAFPFTENLYGDAVARTEIAERWLAAPRLITSFNDGVLQFGPLHTYYLAAFLKLWPDRETSSRLSSLVVGLLTLLPLYRTSLRWFGYRAAVWSGLAFACWGLHIQSSTTAGSEALGLCLFAFALDALSEGLEEGRMGPLARSAVFLNLGCAVRYDLWLYIPLFTLAILLWGQDRIAGLTKAFIFGALASVFPLLWMQGNERATQDAFYPIHFIDAFHKEWTQRGINWLGEAKMRLWGAVFWPGTVVLTLSPLYGLLSLIGMGRAVAKKEQGRRLLVVLAAVPAAFYTFRAAVLLNFSPLARFAITQVFLCIPFAWSGLEWLTAKAPAAVQRGLAAVMALVLVGTPAYVGALSYHADGGWGHTLKPVSPVSTMPVIQMTVAHWLRDHVPHGERLVLDYDDSYTDIGVGFFSNIPDEDILRLRWEDFPKRYARWGARYLIAFKDGKLRARPEAKAEGEALSFMGTTYRPIQSFQGQDFVVYEAAR